jgi:hypothetical protein
MFSKRNNYKLDVKTADDVLQNVFAACDVSPNTIPLDKILKRTKLNLVSDNLLIILAGLLLAFTLLIPTTFPHEDFFISVSHDSDRPLTVTSLDIRDNEFSLSFDGNLLDVSACFMTDGRDRIIGPSAYIEEKNTILFPFDEMVEYNIFIYDVNGRSIHLLLTPNSR